MGVTKSQQNNITSPNGNSLAVFVDGITGVMKVKDVMGNIQPLSDFVVGSGGSPFEYNANATGIQPILGSNTASGYYSTIGGGLFNVASGGRSTIGGGQSNITSNYYATVGGGFANCASACYATVGGGKSNIALSFYSTVGGGYQNTASSSNSTIGGGKYNNASGGYSTVGGGNYNTASGNRSTVGGGANNTACCVFSTVGGGQYNCASGGNSTVGGGYNNRALNTLSTIGGGYQNNITASCSFIGGGKYNNASGGLAFIGGGYQNIASSCYATIGGGVCNTASAQSSTIGGGLQNTASGVISTIGGGRNNIASGNYASILGGRANNTCAFSCAMIVGSNLCATQGCTTFTNCLSADNLTVGCAVFVGANKVLVNSSFTNTGGLFAQTSNSTPITATTVETSLLGVGVGTLSVPANGFTIGGSFTGNMSGIMSAKNNDTIVIRVKSGSVTLAQSSPFTLPAITNQVWNLTLDFTIRTLGGSGVASIVTLGQMHILKLASGTQEGFGFNTVNTTTFDTTISNTLTVTAQWSSNSALNSIYTDLFVLTKIF